MVRYIITEQDLKNIVFESVMQILSEFYDKERKSFKKEFQSFLYEIISQFYLLYLVYWGQLDANNELHWNGKVDIWIKDVRKKAEEFKMNIDSLITAMEEVMEDEGLSRGSLSGYELDENSLKRIFRKCYNKIVVRERVPAKIFLTILPTINPFLQQFPKYLADKSKNSVIDFIRDTVPYIYPDEEIVLPPEIRTVDYHIKGSRRK